LFAQPTTHTPQVSDEHQPADALAAKVHTVLVAELSMDPRHGIRATAADVDLMNRSHQSRVGNRTRTGGPLTSA
jgi:hypothetical protein